ncbi:glycosyltransferase [Cyanobium sp. NIES-981]|uniref:glycosyltransferase n=1 Tax=Cyanobium sp. NIES-981 TaxID=1851505 RepID=UPI0007DE049E|nr:glycosyltransferase [Cyanobium sp. NIES-981]SBO44338.1 putative glycosyltransferase [Cyanobium sp. NIES-981]
MPMAAETATEAISGLSEPLATELEPLRRGPYLGRLEGFLEAGGVGGWALRWPAEPEQGPTPLRLSLSLEDLLDPSRRWTLADLVAQRPRPDLHASGITEACGFLFLGHSGMELPPASNGLVLRAFFDEARRHELPGSPLRLDAEAYARLNELCRLGLGRPACLAGLEGLDVRGWASGSEQLQLRIDRGAPLPITPPEPLPAGEWPFQIPLAASLCDGNLHHLALETTAGELVDERLEILPFQLTPWSVLLEHSRPPFPDHLSPLAAERLRSLQAWLDRADREALPLPAQLPLWQRLLSQPLRRDGSAGPQALPAGHEPGPDGNPVAREPLELPLSTTPRASVIVPVHNQYAITRRCLAALAYAPTAIPFELIVVDDGSSDGTAELLEREAPGVRVVRHEYARGFNQACCSGTAAARGEVIVLLNNDTEPCAHWLDELLKMFELWPDTGLAGAQLIFANGQLQEAGGIVWGNGEPWNYGRGGNPRDPRYSYSREVDYVSGAALAIPRDLWIQVGGFSPEFSPAYYEDTDLAFKVRQAGRRVRYAPLARVVHHEGISNGSDTQASEGLKQYQEINGPRFRTKWAAAFLGPDEPNLHEADTIKDRGISGRALFLDHDTPRPDRDAGSHAAVVEMQLVQSLGWKITFLPANLAWLGSYSEDLQRQGIELIHAPFVLSLEQFLQERGSEFELIYITRYAIAAAALPLIERHAPQARLLFCNADLHHLRELRAVRAAALEGEEAERALAQVREVQRLELEVMQRVHLTLSYSEVERAVIEVESLGTAATAPCPWVVAGPEQPAPLAERSGLSFVGSYGHQPNAEAVAGFLAEVWPQLHERHPELRLHLYGSGMPPALAETWGSIAGVEVEGWVADIATVYDRHRVFIAPLRSGAGLKGKVAAAAAHGIPQVLSPLAAEATGLRDGQEILIARGPDDWLAALDRLLGDDGGWEEMSQAAFRYARTTWSRERGIAMMAEALERLGLAQKPSASPRTP